MKEEIKDKPHNDTRHATADDHKRATRQHRGTTHTYTHHDTSTAIPSGLLPGLPFPLGEPFFASFR